MEIVYGIPPEQVVGSTGKLKYELRDGKPSLMKLPQVDHVDDGPGKPVGIQKFIGRRFMLIVHHTDEAREFAYDRNSATGRLDKALDAANTRGWTVVDMKKIGSVFLRSSSKPNEIGNSFCRFRGM